MNNPKKFSKLFAFISEPVAGYTRLVWLLKYGLWIVVVIMVGWLVVMPLLNPVHERFSLNFSSVQKDATEKPKMTKPRFQGLDGSNQPFYITADSATQESENVIILDQVNGDISTENGGWASVIADSGTIYTEKNELHLYGNVQVYTGDGYEFKTEKATIYTDKSVIEGDEPIKGQGPSGTIDAQSFRIEQGGQIIIFKRDVRLIVFPASKG